jgi:hypothetical protein
MIRNQDDVDRLTMALAPIDQAFHASESKWGVGRLERLISYDTLAAYRRGWDAYRVALEAGDAEAVSVIGPKMIGALAFMDAEASAAGHLPLETTTWEIAMPDGAVLVIVRTQAEQTDVIRAANANMRGEGNLPPDLTIAVRDQHAGRALNVWTIGEIARLISAHGSVAGSAGVKWEGTPAHSGVQRSEGAAADAARSGYPMPEALSF